MAPQVSLSQMVPNPGKQKVLRQIAQQDALMAQTEWRLSQLKVAEQVKRAYYELTYQRQAQATIQANKTLLSRLITIASSRYAVGQGLQQDVLQAQLRLTDLLQAELNADQRATQIVSQINALLNRPPGSPIQTPRQLSLPGQADQAWPLTTLIAQAERSQPEITAARQAIAQAELAVNAAEQDLRPDFQFSLGVGRTMPPEEMTAIAGMAGLSLPVWRQNKQQPLIAAAHEGVNLARARYAARMRSLAAQIEQAIAQIRLAYQQVQLAETGVIPLTSQTFEASLAAYQVGKADALSLLESQRAVFESRLSQQRALADYGQAIAMLESLTMTTQAAPVPAPEK